MIHDAVLIWAYGMNKTLAKGYLPEDGLQVMQNIFSLDFEGITGPVLLDEIGDRQPNYEIQVVQDGQLIRVFQWKTGERILHKVRTVPDGK